MSNPPSSEQIETAFNQIQRDCQSGGYHLNPDREVTLELIKGLIVNTARYGYPSCPCRLAGGNRTEDLDIICPCNYRDPDLTGFNCCYCSLYVSDYAIKNQLELSSIPERRPPKGKRSDQESSPLSTLGLKYPVWRCNVCGYLCARDSAPEVCPICKAGKDRFEKFI